MKILLYADAYGKRVGQTIPYIQFFSQFGEVMLCHSNNDLEFYANNADVLAVPGGADINPVEYGQMPGIKNSRVNPHYEYLDKELLPRFIESEKPIIAICRGMQALNVHLGGDLFQNITGHYQKEKRSETPQKMYSDIKGFFNHPINSMHHQSIRNLGEGLEVISWSLTKPNCYSIGKDSFVSHIYTEKNVKLDSMLCQIEAVKHNELPIVGFQYHPEEFNCEFARKIITENII